MRFWDAGSGKITFGGADIRSVNTAALRSQESFVTQDTELFADTIENNVRIANRNATHEQVVEACQKASLHDFITSLPQGYVPRWGNWAVRFPAASASALAWPVPFCTMLPLC